MTAIGPLFEVIGRLMKDAIADVDAEISGPHWRGPDLLIAASAEAGGAVVWHYDEDFDRIADVTGQPMSWVAPRGTL